MDTIHQSRHPPQVDTYPPDNEFEPRSERKKYPTEYDSEYDVRKKDPPYNESKYRSERNNIHLPTCHPSQCVQPDDQDDNEDVQDDDDVNSDDDEANEMTYSQGDHDDEDVDIVWAFLSN